MNYSETFLKKTKEGIEAINSDFLKVANDANYQLKTGSIIPMFVGDHNQVGWWLMYPYPKDSIDVGFLQWIKDYFVVSVDEVSIGVDHVKVWFVPGDKRYVAVGFYF